MSSDDELVQAFLAQQGATTVPARGAGAPNNVLGQLKAVRELRGKNRGVFGYEVDVYRFDKKETETYFSRGDFVAGLEVGKRYSFGMKTYASKYSSASFRLIRKPTVIKNDQGAAPSTGAGESCDPQA